MKVPFKTQNQPNKLKISPIQYNCIIQLILLAKKFNFFLTKIIINNYLANFIFIPHRQGRYL